MSEPDNFILKLLREIRAEMNQRFDANDKRFDAVDAKLESLKQAMHGESVLGRYATAEFEDRIEAIEKRLDRLEKRS
ncbi:hypothetical protein [Ancylobacter terrae]|uniref:hypothetical protein n=1 Tax=Ancylobacter sp. sgz301288 TaxID=3342077 RepID=UPI0038596F2E